jgi:hypothetical protein
MFHAFFVPELIPIETKFLHLRVRQVVTLV